MCSNARTNASLLPPVTEPSVTPNERQHRLVVTSAAARWPTRATMADNPRTIEPFQAAQAFDPATGLCRRPHHRQATTRTRSHPNSDAVPQSGGRRSIPRQLRLQRGRTERTRTHSSDNQQAPRQPETSRFTRHSSQQDSRSQVSLRTAVHGQPPWGCCYPPRNFRYHRAAIVHTAQNEDTFPSEQDQNNSPPMSCGRAIQ